MAVEVGLGVGERDEQIAGDAVGRRRPREGGGERALGGRGRPGRDEPGQAQQERHDADGGQDRTSGPADDQGFGHGGQPQCSKGLS
ncbi:hypothetical protein ACQP2K_43075 [Microbispora siamensis]